MGARANRSRAGRKGWINRHSECGDNDKTVIEKVMARASMHRPSGRSSVAKLTGRFVEGNKQDTKPLPHQYQIGKSISGRDCVRWYIGLVSP
jgi:hypothetical protein